MPGGDRTGPAGFGPMTGRAAGYCAGYSEPGYLNPILGRGYGFWGRGRGGFGRGFGRGFRRGFGRAYPYYGYEMPYGQVDMSPTQEADMLRHQVKEMEEEIKAINKHIGTLAKTSKKDE